jgi:hypothetical protein
MRTVRIRTAEFAGKGAIRQANRTLLLFPLPVFNRTPSP